MGVTLDAKIAIFTCPLVTVAVNSGRIHLTKRLVAFIGAEAVTFLKRAERDMDGVEAIFFDVRFFVAPCAHDAVALVVVLGLRFKQCKWRRDVLNRVDDFFRQGFLENFLHGEGIGAIV